MIQINFYFTAEMLSQMIHIVRNKVFESNNNNDNNNDNNITDIWNPSMNPLIIEWIDYFPGINDLSGFQLELNEKKPQISDNNPTKFRFICAGLEYFDDQHYIASIT